MAAAAMESLDPLYMATVMLRHRRFEDCVSLCDQLLQKNPLDQAAWLLKVRALTEQSYVDELEVEDEGIAELLLDDNAIADVARPGTSLKKPSTAAGSRATSQGIRPFSQSGRPVSGFLRPGTQKGTASTLEQAMRAPRTAATARPITSASGRFIRLGTASMMSMPDGPFIDASKLNLAKYAQQPALSKALFEYLFHHDNNAQSALQLAALATEACKFEDWWWKLQLGKCYFRVGLYRDAEGQFKSSLRTTKLPKATRKSASEFVNTVDMFLYLARVYVRLDQPMKALDCYRQGLKKFPNNSHLLIGIARIHEGLGEVDQSLTHYHEVLKTDSTCVEAIACIATNHFYSDQPEIALRYYRRLLQMGVCNAELFNNLGLCCYYAQQYDMALSCFQRAITLASSDTIADVWYNIGHIAVGVGDTKLAYHCFKLSLANTNEHAEAYNNLGVLEWQRKRGEQALACFQSSAELAPHLYEPSYNIALASNKIGRLQESYTSAKRAVEVYPGHMDSQELLKQLQHHFAAL